MTATKTPANLEHSPHFRQAYFYMKDDPEMSLFVATAFTHENEFFWHSFKKVGGSINVVRWCQGDERYVFVCDVIASISDNEIKMIKIYQQGERSGWINPKTGESTPSAYRLHYFVRTIREEGKSLREALGFVKKILCDTKIPFLKTIYDDWVSAMDRLDNKINSLQ